MIRPAEMLSAKTLADPRSKQARADLAKFAASERMVQLCNIEAMDQIQLKFRCELARDGASVVGFEFQVGDVVPRARWGELGLPLPAAR